MEREHIVRVLHLARGNKKKASGLLGLDPATLWRKLKKYQIPL
ncbi:MAG: helix-turn-helix domain-containing protein [Thermodesulfovibrionales bacterium]